ncbi:nucleoside deaminase, partial [Streptomyces sp. UH6]|uniref:nucleoside deaminase n=1 Tax=Streptomyces sp. UH6 TaxID=2748379 RepID=UPI00211DB24D
HERLMRLAVEQGRRNPLYPFGAVVADARSGDLLAAAVNDAGADPTLHGEITAMRAYVARHGNGGWDAVALYSTGEPCAMCMAAIAWAGVAQVVWGSSIPTLRRTGIPQISLRAHEVARSAASFHRPELLLGGVLEAETDALFEEARRRREAAARP